MQLSRRWFQSPTLLFVMFLWSVSYAQAQDYSGSNVHRHHALRQFWRQLEQELNDEIDEFEPAWFHHKHMSGDWAGQRSALATWGIVPTLTYVSHLLGNPSGGRSRKIAYTDNLGLDIEVDVEQLARWRGLTFHVSGSLRSGRSLSKVAIGNTFPVSNLFGGETLRFYELYVEQSFSHDSVSIVIGRFGIGDEFATSPLYSLFLNNAIDGNPLSISLNIPAFSAQSYPVAQWGIRTKAQLSEAWSVMAGISNGDRTVSRNHSHGLDFAFRSNADIFTIGEIRYHYGHDDDATSLIGNYKFGGYYDAGPFLDLYYDRDGRAYITSGLPPHKAQQNYGLYFLVDQQIFREDDETHRQGLIPIVGVTFAPADINLFPFFFLAGIVYHGPILGRDRDTLGVSIAYGQFSHDLQRSQRLAQPVNTVQRFELAIELTYQYEATPHLILQPDVQYIVRPGGTGRIPDALMIGFQIAINL